MFLIDILFRLRVCIYTPHNTILTLKKNINNDNTKITHNHSYNQLSLIIALYYHLGTFFCLHCLRTQNTKPVTKSSISPSSLKKDFHYNNTSIKHNYPYNQLSHTIAQHYNLNTSAYLHSIRIQNTKSLCKTTYPIKSNNLSYHGRYSRTFYYG